jgi:hypothetical protein
VATLRGRALLGAILARLAQVPRDEAIEEFERAVQEILAGASADRALGLIPAAGRPAKVYTAADVEAARFMLARITGAGGAYGSIQAAICAALEQTFDGQRFDYEQLAALLRRFLPADVRDEWRLAWTEVAALAAHQEWWPPPL